VRRPLLVLVGAGVLVLTLVVGVVVGAQAVRGFGLLDFGRGEFTDAGPTVVQGIRDLSSLTTVEVIEATTIERGHDAGFLDFLRGERVALLAVARIGAGVDLSQLGEDDVDVDPDVRRVTIVLPPPEITFVALDNDATRVYDRDLGLLTRGDPQLESEARRAAEDVLRRGALDAGILDEAERSARTAVASFLRSLGFEDVTVRTRR
jgi:hypothetical protein